jgi:hypothetical protein
MENKMGNKYTRTIRNEAGEAIDVDVYDVLEAFNATCPAIQHALKKLLAPGQRGVKSTKDDVVEAVQSLNRAVTMENQRNPPMPPKMPAPAPVSVMPAPIPAFSSAVSLALNTYNATMKMDGDKWCMTQGLDSAEGPAGFGVTPEAALEAFKLDLNLHN